MLAALNICICFWQEGDQENAAKDSLPVSRTGLRNSTTSVTNSKVQRLKTTGRKKPIVQKKSSVTLTQMVGSSDSGHLQTATDTENVRDILFHSFILVRFFERHKDSLLIHKDSLLIEMADSFGCLLAV